VKKKSLEYAPNGFTMDICVPSIAPITLGMPQQFQKSNITTYILSPIGHVIYFLKTKLVAMTTSQSTSATMD
jgi:hypothetical protein